MRLSAEKWGNLTVTGTNRYKALVVELAAQHGFQVANPELQDQIRRETARQDRLKAERPGFTAGNVEKSATPTQTPASTALQVPPVAQEAQPSNAAAGELPVAERREQRWIVNHWDAASRSETTILVTDSAAPADRLFRQSAEHSVKDSRTGTYAATIDWQQDGSTPVHRIVSNDFRQDMSQEKVQPVRTEAEISIALERVRERTHAEAQRETGAANTSSRTGEMPY